MLEAQPTIGGAVASAEDVHPGFVHDTFSAFYPLAAASPTIESLRLEEHGLTWRHAPGGARPSRSPDGQLGAAAPRPRRSPPGWRRPSTPATGRPGSTCAAEWDAGRGASLIDALLARSHRSDRHCHSCPACAASAGSASCATLLTPAAELGRERFGGDGPAVLLAGNAGHADIPLDAPGSGLLGLLMTMLGQTVGFPVPEGGAGRLADALAPTLHQPGAARCGAMPRSSGSTSTRGRATGVRTATSRVRARRAVVADVAAPHLFGGCWTRHDVPARVARGMAQFEMDPGTVKVDWALSGPVPWLTEPAYAPGTVHVADSLGQMQEALSQVWADAVPAAPFMLTGQMTTSDSTRSPAGTESFWAYTHVPQRTRTDAGTGEIRGALGPRRPRAVRRPDAGPDRTAGAGLRRHVLARRVLGPRELEARNANLIGGAVGGGTAQLHQELVFRPVPGLGRAETGIAGLYLGSAAAHPGGGVHGAAGSNAARAAVLHDRLRLRRGR